MSTISFRILAAILMTGLFSMRPSAAQSPDPMQFSPAVGMILRFDIQNRSIASFGDAGSRIPGVVVPSGGNVTGSGDVFSAGGEISIPILFGGRLGLVGRLLYTQSSERLSSDRPGYALWDEDTRSYYLSRSDLLEAVTESARLELLADLRIGKRLHLRCGPTLDYRFSPSSRRPNDGLISLQDDATIIHFSHDSLLISIEGERIDVTVHQNGRVEKLLLPRSGLDVPSRTFGISGIVGVSYDLPIGRGMMLAPEVTFQGFIPTAYTGADEVAYRIGAGISILGVFNRSESDLHGEEPSITPEPERTVVPDPIVDRELDVVPLTATISVHGVGLDESILSYADVRIYETLSRDVPLGEWEIGKELVPPVLLIDPQYSETAVRWRIRFHYGDTIIAEASSDDESALARVNWSIASESDSTCPLSVELTVFDSAGASLTAVDRISTRIRRFSRIVERHDESTLYTLYPFEENSDLVDVQNEAVLSEIVEGIEEGSTIAVTGFIDETEETTSAQERSSGRAEEVVRILRAKLSERGKNEIPIETALHVPYTETSERSLRDGRNIRPHIQIVVAR